MRDDMYFHNGDKVTANDLNSPSTATRRRRWRRAPRTGASRSRGEVRHRSHIHSRRTLRDASGPALDLRQRHPAEAYIEKVGMTEFMAHPIGSGPYRIVSYNRDARLVLEAFDSIGPGRRPSRT